MTLSELRQLTEPINEKWGDRMKLMVCEECGELIQMISKTYRAEVAGKEFSTVRPHLVEEMADVFLVLGALMNHCGVYSDEIEIALANKLKQERTA